VGTQRHPAHVVNQMVLKMSLAFRAAADHDCDADDEVRHNYVDEVPNRWILESPPSGLRLNAAPRQLIFMKIQVTKNVSLSF
jgi:hypothetical protein